MQRDLFETPVDRVLRDLPEEIANQLRALLERAPIPSEELETRITAHVRRIEDAAHIQEFLDLPLVRALAAKCQRLVSHLSAGTPNEHRALIQAAVLYFVLEDDADSDTASLLGFDDDALVVNAVLEEVGGAE